MAAKRITLVAIGTRGDVQPFCVLGRALADRGFDVAIATEKRLENLVVNEFRLPYRYVAGDCTGLLFEPTYQKDLAEGSIFTVLKLLKQWRRQYSFDELLASYVEALKDSDIIVAGSMSLSESYAIAEKNNAVWVPFLLWPAYPTREMPIWMMSKLTFGFGFLNLWSYSFLFKQLWTAEQKFINPWRQNVLGLPPVESLTGTMGIVFENENIPALIACSKLFCGPRRIVPPEYDPKKVHMLGPVFPSPSPLPDKVTSFLTSAKDDAKAVVYIGFGSMPSEKPLSLLQMTLDVCTLASCRAIVVAGWSELGSDEAITLLNNNAKTLLVVSSLPLGSVFPQVDCIVHHCGIGTCNVALLSGKPQIPCPVMFDQPVNAQVLVDVGVASRIRPYQSLTAKQIADDVSEIMANSGDIQRKAKEVASSLQEECSGALEGYCDAILNTQRLNAQTK